VRFWKDIIWIKDDLWGLVNTETKVLFSKESGEFLEHLRDCPILRKDQFKAEC
jgi:hypothetical protein